MRKILLSLSLLVVSVASFCQRSENHNSVVSRNLEIFNEIYKNLDLFYVDSLSADTVIQWAIDGMLLRVDPFTGYFPEDDDNLRQMATGKYAGIGSIIRFNRKEDRACISEPYAGTPSVQAGLKAGDVIISIDGKDIKGMPISTVSSMLRGEAGTTFELKYQRPGQKKPSIARITRRIIQMPNVPYYGMLNDTTGYILLTGFTDGAAKETRHALEELKRQGAQKLVLDLRNNPGGALNEAVDIVNLFVDKGRKVVYTQGKLTATNREYFTTSEPLDTIMPMVVLVNESSASSSEIVCGSLQDMDRAVVAGSRTYGKGLVQMIREISYRGQMKVTTSRYYIPSGRCIQAYDYKHDGTTQTVPDSLQKTFYTHNGRPVKDGGGIKPDVQIQPDSLPTMIYDLVQSDAYFDYATQYCQTHPTIAQPQDFHLTDQEYDDFVQYIAAQDFKYNQRSEELLRILKKWITTEGYMDKAKNQVQALEECLKSNTTEDLYRLKGDVLTFLENEIVRRYYFQAGAIRQQLTGDQDVRRACQILDNTDEYNQILGK